MLFQESFLKKIKDFGLNSYEAKIWTALLSRGVATAGELADISNVPRSRSYDVLESLEKKGFIIMKIGKPIKYIAVPPDEVVERVKKKVNQDAEQMLSMMDELKDSPVLKELMQLHNNGIESVEPSEISGAIKSQSNIYDHLNLMLKKAENDVLIVTTANGLKRKVNSLLRQIKKLGDRGVNVRIAAPITDDNKEFAKLLSDYAEIRSLNTDLKARFVIVDNKEMTFMLTDDDKVHPDYDVGVWVNTPFFSEAVNKLFDGLWINSEPFNLN